MLKNPAVAEGSEEWQRDIPRWGRNLDRTMAVGATKLRSIGTLRASRRGDTVDIDGNVRHVIDDPYDFNEDTWFDRNAFAFARERARIDKAKPFRVKGLKTHKIGGQLEIRKGVVDGSGLFWSEDH